MKSRLLESANYQFRRLKEYTQRYIHIRMDGDDARKKILWELFGLSNAFLQELDIEYWVNFGTLLGFYREKDIISHDLDIDFGCHEENYSLILDNQDKLPEKLSLHDTTFKHHGPKLYMSYKGFDADIYFYRTDEDNLYSYEKTHWENYNAPIPKKFTFPTEPLSIDGIDTRIPAKTEEYLRTIYGNLSASARRNPETGYWE